MFKVRIIGGIWRGRKISFAKIKDVRPTPDRVRETLFNWLAPYINQAVCLDCFAGSGALGFEALSRGAAWVVMVDKSKAVVTKLKENAEFLKAEKITFYQEKFPLSDEKLPIFDIVFLDPPYYQNLIAPCCKWLEESQGLHLGSLIFIEAEKTLWPLPLPSNWQVLKSKKTGQVGYHLVRRN
jgi:16S rRNA (guanine966-N2)-methyltransferase